MKKRTAVVTGGTRGIGRGICELLKEEGYDVVAGYAGNEEAAAKFSEETGIETRKWDVADFDACQEAIEAISASHGNPTVLVNNAGITRDGTLKRMSYDDWMNVIQTNLTSVFNMCKGTWAHMVEENFGRIVNISSVNGQAGQYGQVNYCAAKAGVIGMTKALAQEGARFNITANTVAPGYVATDMVAAVPQNILDKIVGTIPVGRLGDASEIARAVWFLCREDSMFVTGSTISINGGQHMY
ncbi:acetoacetyl-CoA reductase [Salaquimonas pukyongi]|uniref:acetoacetyl-CoA reductase n=1 Tax=Salaquimonas pukyongi TaxID=2712698 RepID=UPI00096BB589|nr:acetoacetyl-CoA reductase [Salaquimonas pukyongi]